MISGLIAAVLLGGFLLLITGLHVASLLAAMSKPEPKEPGKVIPFKDKEQK